MELTRKEFMLSAAALSVVGCTTCGVGSGSDFKRKEGAGMLKGISPVISPDLLKDLAAMGHGDEFV